ncbi:MAG: hypothetical protein WAV90_02540 [Gordonia amarae]
MSSDGIVIPHPPAPWPGYLELAQTNPDVSEALTLLGQSSTPGWVELYKVHEIVRDSIKPNKIYEIGWADKATDSAFTGSANLPGVSGSDALHARRAGSPTNTMTNDRARAYIGRLVAMWLDKLGSEQRKATP